MEELIYTQKELYERYQRWVKKATASSSLTTAPDYKPDYDVCASPPYGFHRFARYIGETFGEKHAEAYTKAVVHYQIKLRQSFELQSPDPPAGKLLNKVDGRKFKVESFDLAWMSARFGVFWIPDVDVDHCQLCNAPFNFLLRKHHCRMCGRVVCDPCSPGRKTVPNSPSPERACKDCCATPVQQQPCCSEDHPPAYKPPQQVTIMPTQVQPPLPTDQKQELLAVPSFAEERPQKTMPSNFPPPGYQSSSALPEAHSGEHYIAPLQYQFYQPQVAPSYYMPPQYQHPQQPQQQQVPMPQFTFPSQSQTQTTSPFPTQPPPPSLVPQSQPQQQPQQQQSGFDPSGSVSITYQTTNSTPYTPNPTATFPNLYGLLDPKSN